MTRRKPKSKKKGKKKMENETAENETSENNTEDSYEFGDNFRDDMAEHFSERQQDREDEAAEDKKEIERLDKHLNKNGDDFKSLHDRKAYYDPDYEELEPQPPFRPDQRRYGPDEDDQHDADVDASFRSHGMKLSDGLNAFPDDPHGSKRQELMTEFSDWTEKEIAAEGSGNIDSANRAKFFKKDIAKQLRNLPPPPVVEHMRKLEGERDKDALKSWQAGEFPERGFTVEDAGTIAANHIRAGSGLLFLPKEKSPYGPIEPFTPENVVDFSHLPGRVKRQVTQAVINARASGMDAVGQVAMATLHKLGYSDAGKPGPAAKPPKKAKKKSSDAGYRKGMSMAEFSAWRERNGAQPY